ncbi:uncharacterized protein [Phyllobates terribilis]|uniref:uncharacterized protein n=1 Tax=Phyllobates terribilis TaxID=111132 RepID=UPI003CCAAAC8
MRAHLLLLTAYAITVTEVTSANPNNTEHVKSHVTDTGSLSKPIIKCSLLANNTMHITCFSESGPLPIRYQLFLSDRMEEKKVLNKSEPAQFIINMSPVSGAELYFNCTAISPTGEKSSNNLTLRMDNSPPIAEEAKTDNKDKDSGLEYLIPLEHILTSVTSEVLKWNKLLLIICGPIFLIILVIIVTISYLRSQKEQHMDV